MQWWLAALKNYVGFSGRARRTEFWMFFLFQFIIFAILGILGRVSSAFLIVYYLYLAATLIPTLAVGARRLHDTGRSGFWWFIDLIPIVGQIILIVFWCLDSTPGPNQHGPNPKEPGGSGWQGEVQAPAWPSYPPADQPYGQGQQPYPQGQPQYPQGQPQYPQGQPQYPQYPPQGGGYPQQQGQPPYPGQ
jgi:uncharacterized membrane protein YhaH (DUF805 family)